MRVLLFYRKKQDLWIIGCILSYNWHEMSCLNSIICVDYKYWSNKCMCINILGAQHTLLAEDAGPDHSLSDSIG